MGIIQYKRQCRKNIGGNNSNLIISDNIELVPQDYNDSNTAVTDKINWTNKNGVLQIDDMLGLDETIGGEEIAQELQADIDTIEFNQDVEATSRSRVNTQTMEVTLSGDPANFLFKLSKAIPCGITIFRIDKNGRGWVSGLPASLDLLDLFDLPVMLTEQIGARKWQKYSIAYTSGESIADIESGNKHVITFERLCKTTEIELVDSALNNLKVAMGAKY